MEKEDLTLDELRGYYNDFINMYCNKFLIKEKKMFSIEVTNLIKMRPSDQAIENDKDKLKDWNVDLMNIVIKYSTYDYDDILAMIDLDLKIALTDVAKE